MMKKRVVTLSADESLIESIEEYGKYSGKSMRKIADEVHIHQSLISKAKHKKAKLPEYLDPALSGLNWRIAIEIASEHSGGFISNVLKLDPSLDLSPSGLKERLTKDLREAYKALDNLHAYQANPDKESVITALSELYDVLEVGIAAFGRYEELYGINHDEFIRIHNQQRKEHRR